jgi:ABC-2 type transport system permease protein
VSDLGLAVRQVRYENKAFWRNPASAFFTFAFPLMFLVIFNLIFGSETTSRFGCFTATGAVRKFSVSNFYIPTVTAFAVISACYTNIAITVAFNRDEGILKRLRGTPLPSWVYLFGRIVHAIIIAMILVVIVILFGRAFYHVELPTKTLPAFIATLAVGAACFSALGLAVTAIIPNADASPAVVNATILPLLFISDVFIPLNNAPGYLTTFSNIFPVKHFSHGLLTAYSPCPHGSAFVANDLIVMAAWCVGAVVLSARFFSWEPRT